jgi:hypothetical protein
MTMKINQDTGNVILTEAEIMEVSIADDDMNTIESIIKDFNNALARIQKLKTNGTMDIDHKDLFYAQGCIQDAIDDMFAKTWRSISKKAYRDDENLPKLTAIKEYAQ